MAEGASRPDTPDPPLLGRWLPRQAMRLDVGPLWRHPSASIARPSATGRACQITTQPVAAMGPAMTVTLNKPRIIRAESPLLLRLRRISRSHLPSSTKTSGPRIQRGINPPTTRWSRRATSNNRIGPYPVRRATGSRYPTVRTRTSSERGPIIRGHQLLRDRQNSRNRTICSTVRAV